MRYYTIQENDSILIADNQQALSRFYDTPIYELPEDYEQGKYIVGEVEEEIKVPDFEIVDIEVEIHDIDEEGNYIYDEDGNPVTHTETRPVQEQVGTHTEVVTVKKLVPNPNWEEEQYIRREREFNKAFFNTSLGYIRRSVTMADGSHKDFLSDLLPVISMGVQSGMPVNILTYDMPPFDEDVTDWTEYQHQVVVTPQFIQECFLQLSADFAPINNEEENADTTD